MSEISMTEARDHFAEAVERARHDEPVTILRHGKPVAAIVNAEWFDRALEALEDAEDRADAVAAREDEGPDMTLEELRTELGY